jgi:hypothetical protein
MPRIGMGAGPSQIFLDPESPQSAFGVANGGDIEEQISIEVRDFFVDADGHRVPAERILASPAPTTSPALLASAATGSPAPDASPSPSPFRPSTLLVPPVGSGITSTLTAASWLRLETLAFDLAAGETRNVRLMVTIPPDATPGDHVAEIRILGGPSEAAWAEIEQHVGGAVFKSKIASVITVMIRVPGQIEPRIAVPPFEASMPGLITTLSGDWTFTPEIVNQGNVAAVWRQAVDDTIPLAEAVPTMRLITRTPVLADDRVLFAGSPETPDKRAMAASLLVLPGATHTQRLTLTDAPLFGTYDYIYTLPGSAADGRETITRTGSFTVVNLQKVLFWIVLPLLLLLLLGSLVAFRRHRIGTQRRVAAALRARELQLARQEAYEQAWREQQAAHGHHPR